MNDAVSIGPAPRVLPDSAYLRQRPPRYTLSARNVLDRPLEQVVEFFAAAENLASITPPEMGFTILTPTPIDMGVGTLIDYRVRVSGIPLRWQTRIEVWEPGERFVDSQLRGPYACWWHEHRFEPDANSTVMFDTVHYAPPLGPLGVVAQHLLIARQLRHIFAYRGRVIAHRFCG